MAYDSINPSYTKDLRAPIAEARKKGEQIREYLNSIHPDSIIKREAQIEEIKKDLQNHPGLPSTRRYRTFPKDRRWREIERLETANREARQAQREYNLFIDAVNRQ